MGTDPNPALSFDEVASEYERHRPDYPATAVAWIADRLEIQVGTRVLDIGAGTGKLTRALLALGAAVVAVEPGAKMLAELRAVAPDAEALEGTAEAIPLAAANVDVAAAGQAYHWFDPARAVPELHRVLRPRGGLALVWNWWDLADPRQRRLAELAGRARSDFGTAPGPPWFEETDREAIPSEWELTVDRLVARFATSSAVITASPARREALLAEVRELGASFGGDTFSLPRVTHVFAFRRLDP